MPESFTYLVSKERPRGGAAVEDRYRIADLAARPVVRDEWAGRYHVFEGRRELFDWYAGVPEGRRCCHEVVFGRLPQRLKFDVDAPAHKLDALPEGVLAAAGARPPGDRGRLPPGAGALLASLLGEAEEGAPPPAAGAPSAAASEALAEAGRAAKAAAVVELLIDAVLDELYVAYYGIEDVLPAREDLAVTDSGGPTAAGWKYSYHLLVLPYYVADNLEAGEFTARVLERLPEPVRAFVDPDVNKSVQCFRLAGSTKLGAARYKRATPEVARLFGTAAGLGPEELLCTAPPGARVLPRAFADAAPSEGAARGRRRPGGGAPPPLHAGSPLVAAALELAGRAGVTRGHTLGEVRGALLCFRREEPSSCRICGEVHHRDNSLMLSVEPVEAGHRGAWPGTGPTACRVVEHCRQARGRGRALGEIVVSAEELRAAADRDRRGRGGGRRKAAAAPPAEAAPGGDDGKGPGGGALGRRIAERVGALARGAANPHDAARSEFERLPAAQKTVYDAPEMRDYELKPTLAVLAQMKLGKTKALRRYLDAHFPADGLETRVVRFVTFRQTFGRSLAEAFPDFELYSDLASGEIDQARHPRVVVQVESLHRLRMPPRGAPIDLLVLDEAESILAQFSSGLARHFAAAWAMFQWLLRTARHVVCMDANLGDRTFRTLARMRPQAPPHFHWNRHQRAAGDSFLFTADQGAWLAALHARLRAGERLVVPTNSLAEARAYDEALRRAFPQKRVRLYSAETPPSEKARHFGDVHTHWAGLDVLIYTPTCTAGVSFELEHFDALFGYFTDASCDVETCRQMLARVRSLRARTHVICLRAARGAFPETTADIRRLLLDKRATLRRGDAVGDPALSFEYDPDGGGIRFYESDYFHLWLETTRVANLSRNDFARRFIDQVADTGASVGVLGADAGGPGGAAAAALLAAHRATRDELRAGRHEAVAAAADLAPEEAARLREALRAQEDVAPADRLALDKYHLREAYAWHGRPLDAAFVAAYEPPAARRVYRALCAVTEAESPEASVGLMRRREAEAFAFATEDRAGALRDASEGRDVLRERTAYVSHAHSLVLWLLLVVGLPFGGRGRVHAAALEARLRAALPGLARQQDRFVAEFELPRVRLARLGDEADPGRFLAAALRFVNAPLRFLYGLEVRRVGRHAGGHAYYLDQSAVGRLFVFAHEPEPDDTPGGPRPHIPSNLAPTPEGAAADGDGALARIALFLEEEYFAPPGAPRRAREPSPPDGSGSDADVGQPPPPQPPSPPPPSPPLPPRPAPDMDSLLEELLA